MALEYLFKVSSLPFLQWRRGYFPRWKQFAVRVANLCQFCNHNVISISSHFKHWEEIRIFVRNKCLTMEETSERYKGGIPPTRPFSSFQQWIEMYTECESYIWTASEENMTGNLLCREGAWFFWTLSWQSYPSFVSLSLFQLSCSIWESSGNQEGTPGFYELTRGWGVCCQGIPSIVA